MGLSCFERMLQRLGFLWFHFETTPFDLCKLQSHYVHFPNLREQKRVVLGSPKHHLNEPNIQTCHTCWLHRH